MSEQTKKRVLELFNDEHYYCAETVLSIIAEAGNRCSDDIVKMATGFCSGASRTCGQCGAVSGAIMGIGLFAGRSKPGADYDGAYALVQEFLDEFVKKYGSINCYELIGCDFSTVEGQTRFQEKGLKRKCYIYCTYAAEAALTLLREHGYLAEHEDNLRSCVAPCGLSCGKCVAFAGGGVQRSSAALMEALGDNFANYAERFAAMQPVFKGYGQFRELLEFFASGSCSGCREKGCLFKACKVAGCVKEHGVDYCFECDAFPCDRHGMPESLARRWQANNEKMREIGMDAWACGCMDKPRYP